MFFPYDNQAIEYLSAKDKHLGEAIAGGAIPGLTDPATRKVPAAKQAPAPSRT